MKTRIQNKPLHHDLIYKMVYRKGGVEIVTMPLALKGYYVFIEELGPTVFVKSELTKAERKEVISWGLSEHGRCGQVEKGNAHVRFTL